MSQRITLQNSGKPPLPVDSSFLARPTAARHPAHRPEGTAVDLSIIPVLGRVPPTLQAKRLSGAQNDALEREADSVAETIARRGSDAGRAERASLRSPETPQQLFGAHPAIDRTLRAPGRPLDGATRDTMESHLGHDLSGVRVHTDGVAAEAAEAMHAKAFTVGRNIVFRAGAMQGGDAKRLLAHELTHVVQQGRSGAAALQRDKAGDDVKKVSSPTLDAADQDVDDGQDQLDRREAKREKEIQGQINQLGTSKNDQARKKRLETDLNKDEDDIIKHPDSTVNPALRNDIVQSSRSLKKLETRRDNIKKKWTELDPDFASPKVRAALGSNTLTPAELKALIAKESGDLMDNDQKGDIAGIAQLGTTEEKAAGGKRGDRKDKHKAILLCAKTLAIKAAELDKRLTNPPSGKDRKKFIMASYNGGVNMVVQSQNAAIAGGKKGDTWAELIASGNGSFLHAGIQKTYAKGRADGKFREVKTYIDGIYSRLSAVKP